MTTNFKTAIRTGGLPTQGPQNAGSFFGNLVEKFKSTTPKQKIIGAGIIVLIIGLVLVANIVAQASKYVPLTADPMSQSDIAAVTQKLGEFKIPVQMDTVKKTVLVPPGKLSNAVTLLSQYGLPRTPVNLPATANGNSIMPPSQEQLTEQRRLELQVVLTNNIRSIEGIANATVNIAQPKENLFAPTTTTAAVMVQLAPGAKLDPTQVAGIAYIVSSSVPNLKVENVKVIDNNGRPLAMDTKYLDQNKENIAQLPEVEKDKVIGYENRLKEKIKEALDPVLGSDTYSVGLNVDMDFSQKEINSETYGGAANVEGEVTNVEKTEETTVNKNSIPEAKDATQISAETDAIKKGGEFKTTKTEKSKVVDKTTRREITAPGTVKRVTATITVDNQKEDQAGKVKVIVANTIGIDESRGDKIDVVSMPFMGISKIDEMQKAIAANPAMPKQGTPVGSSALLLALALMPTLLLILVVAYLMVKQRNMLPEPRFAQGISTATQVDINKSYSTGADARASSTAFKLEMLAKEKPTRVAELLKSTWLADKER